MALNMTFGACGVKRAHSKANSALWRNFTKFSKFLEILKISFWLGPAVQRVRIRRLFFLSPPEAGLRHYVFIGHTFTDPRHFDISKFFLSKISTLKSKIDFVVTRRQKSKDLARRGRFGVGKGGTNRTPPSAAGDTSHGHTTIVA